MIVNGLRATDTFDGRRDIPRTDVSVEDAASTANVAALFPNEQALVRLVSAVLVETS